jgi:hypothetical protein
VDEYRAAARRIVQVLGEPATQEFVTLLESVDEVRADTFRQLYDAAATMRYSTRCTTWRSIRSCVAGWSSICA